MAMKWVTRPAAGIVDDFTNDEVRLRTRGAVEDEPGRLFCFRYDNRRWDPVFSNGLADFERASLNAIVKRWAFRAYPRHEIDGVEDVSERKGHFRPRLSGAYFEELISVEREGDAKASIVGHARCEQNARE